LSATAQFHTNGRRYYNKLLNGVQAPPATLYIGLRTLDGTGSHPSDAAIGDTLASATTLAEVSGGGYARVPITVSSANVAEAVSGNNSVLTFSQVTFSFTGTLSGITHAFLATSSDNTGTLLASAPLSVTRNVANGDQLKETFTFTLSSPTG